MTSCPLGSGHESTQRCPRRDRGNRCPRAARPAALGTIPYPGGRRAWHHLGAGRSRGDHYRIDRGCAEIESRAASHRHAGRPHRQPLSRRCRRGGTVLRLAHRPPGPEEALHGDPRALPDRDGGDGVLTGLRHLRPLQDAHGRRNRGRVRGDQLGDPGADPRALSGTYRPGDQRQLLARRRRGRAGRGGPARYGLGARGDRLAARLRPGRRARAWHPPVAALDTGKPALADAARAHRRGGSHRRGHRTTSRGKPAGTAAREATPASASPHHGRRRRHPLPGLSEAHAARRRADGDPGVLL